MIICIANGKIVVCISYNLYL